MPNPRALLYPIIYVRGYAMTKSEQNETTADPFCGFNLGSTVYRATPDKEKPAKKFIFESPVLRLTTDYGYKDVYENGLDIMDPDWEGVIPPRSIVIYRYYDESSDLLGDGKTLAITEFAKGLSKLVLRVKELVCQHKEYKDAKMAEEDFRCYLVAHSMGGLVCRAFLQNPDLDEKKTRKYVDKVFTYATPHNGIEMVGMNVPELLSLWDMNNFNRDKMAGYLKLTGLKGTGGRADWVPESVFPSRKFFCMVGTNRADYKVALGLSRTFAGHGSDGLVQIENASVWGLGDDGKVSDPCATAYAYRSHSGYYGIVNSEEAYQNLTRFLFGDIRVDIWADVTNVTLPEEIAGQNVDALYQFEVLAAPRGKRWYLTRRQAEEDSVACCRHKDLKKASETTPKSIYLSTVFLANKAKVSQDDRSLAYSLTFGVRVPDYEINQKFWFNGHYEGGYLYRDTMIVEITPPSEDAPKISSDDWVVNYGWQQNEKLRGMHPLNDKTLVDDKVILKVPFKSTGTPGISGQLRFVVSAWNT